MRASTRLHTESIVHTTISALLLGLRALHLSLTTILIKKGYPPNPNHIHHFLQASHQTLVVMDMSVGVEKGVVDEGEGVMEDEGVNEVEAGEEGVDILVANKLSIEIGATVDHPWVDRFHQRPLPSLVPQDNTRTHLHRLSRASISMQDGSLRSMLQDCLKKLSTSKHSLI